VKLPTTSVGSFPKPDYLKQARREYLRGEIDVSELKPLEEKATVEWIKIQEDIGIDILVDGEMYRGDMATYFAENLSGFQISGLVRSYGNRYYRKPVITGKILRPKPVTLDWFKFTQGLTSRPVKGMVTGPYTMMDWSFNEYYDSREDAAIALAEVLHKEVVDLERAGAKYIQIDEPAISVRPCEIDLAIKAMAIVTDGVKAKTITHICYGDFAKIYPEILEIPVDMIDLELSNSALDMLPLMKKYPFTKEIGFGVIDVHTHVIETKEVVKERIRQALEVIPREKIYIDPDCGLKTRTVDETIAKLKVMVEAVQEL